MQRIFSDPEDNEVDDQKGNAQKQGDLHRMFQGAQANVADPAAFPDAEQVVCGDFRNIAGTLPLSPEDYVVVMTSGHLHDLEIQEQILRQELAYVGVIGSRAKIAAVNARLREAGISEEKLHTVHAPVGTPIKAVTPAEIAVSITGEMIYERACRREDPAHHACPMV